MVFSFIYAAVDDIVVFSIDSGIEVVLQYLVLKLCSIYLSVVYEWYLTNTSSYEYIVAYKLLFIFYIFVLI